MSTAATFSLIASGSTAGQPVACVDATAAPFGATSMAGVRDELAPLLEEIRLSWFDEHGGDPGSIVAVLTRAPRPGSDLGLLFVAAAGPLGGCGEATMFAGAVRSRGAGTSLVLDTTTGPVVATDRGAGQVVLRMPAVHGGSAGHRVDLGAGTALVRTISVAGNAFVALPARSAGLDLDALSPEELRVRGDALLRSLAGGLAAAGEPRPGLLLLTEPVTDGCTRSAVVWDGILNRGPCGTGTCARMVLAAEDGLVADGGVLTHLSPFGESFEARLAAGAPRTARFRVEIAGQVVVAAGTGVRAAGDRPAGRS